MESKQPQKIPKLLTIASVLPIAFLAILPPDWFNRLNLFGFLYLAMTYSFLGGSHWGVGLLHEEEDNLYFLSVVPLFFSTLAIYLYSHFTILHNTLWVLFIIAFLWQAILDFRFIKHDVLPQWYRRVRMTGTLLMVVATSACVLRLVFQV